MNHELICDLADCTEFRQTVEARPPVIVHGAAALLVLLISAGLIWAGLAEANIVVTTTGRVRPVDQPVRVFAEAGTDIDGRVAEVFVKEGSRVTNDQVLLRLDTQRLDIQREKLDRKVAAAEEELAELEQLDRLMKVQFRGAKAQAQAELAKAAEDLSRAKKEQTSQIRAARAELDIAKDRMARQEQLVSRQAVTAEEYVKAQHELRQAREKLTRTQLPIDDGQLSILQKALEQVDNDFAVRRAELAARQVAKRAEADAARKDLANVQMELERSVLRSPIDGIVVSGEVKPGDVLELGKPVFEVAQQEGFHFEVAVPSEDVGQLAIGMPVKIKFDAFDYQKYGTLDGTLHFIAPDSQVARSGRTSTKLSPVSYIVRIQLHGAHVGRDELRGYVKLGLGGTAEIVTQRETLLAIFFRQLRGTISLG